MKVYKKLSLDVELPEYIERDIQEMLDFLNGGGDPRLADVYQSTIRTDINECEKYDFDEDIGLLLRNYYVRGGIFVEED